MPAANKTTLELTVPSGVPALLRDLLHERTGIYFDSTRFDALLEKLHDRAVARGCRSYLDYYYILKDDEPSEWLRVIEAFSVQETYFWREHDQMQCLVDHVIPAWFARQRRPLRIWSAACASGEEPYSLAIALREAGWGEHPISIQASDASEAALEKARLGVYRERSFRALPPGLQEKYFDAPTAAGSRLRREFLPPVTFQRANLVVPAEIATLATSPVIFCRNVFIYFSSDAVAKTVAAFAARLPDEGHLFVGAAESLLQRTTAFELRTVGNALVYIRTRRASP